MSQEYGFAVSKDCRAAERMRFFASAAGSIAAVSVFGKACAVSDTAQRSRDKDV